MVGVDATPAHVGRPLECGERHCYRLGRYDARGRPNGRRLLLAVWGIFVRTNIASSRPAPASSTGIQYGALPYRFTGDTLEILLITTRRTKRWIVPKGWPIAGLTPARSAAREALEEAGISGEVDARPLGRFQYVKEFRQRLAVLCRVEVFALKVTRQRRDWEEKAARDVKWVVVEEAVRLIEEPGLRRLIHKFANQINTNELV